MSKLFVYNSCSTNECEGDPGCEAFTEEQRRDFAARSVGGHAKLTP